MTGFLAYPRPDVPDAPGTVVQDREGSTEAVRAVLRDRLRPSHKHHRTEVMHEGPRLARSFPGWTMAFGRTRTGALDGFSDLINRLGSPPPRDP